MGRNLSMTSIYRWPEGIGSPSQPQHAQVGRLRGARWAADQAPGQDWSTGMDGSHDVIVTGRWWLEHDWILVPFSWECHHPNWRTHIFQRDWNHQPDNFWDKKRSQMMQNCKFACAFAPDASDIASNFFVAGMEMAIWTSPNSWLPLCPTLSLS